MERTSLNIVLLMDSPGTVHHPVGSSVHGMPNLALWSLPPNYGYNILKIVSPFSSKQFHVLKLLLFFVS